MEDAMLEKLSSNGKVATNAEDEEEEKADHVLAVQVSTSAQLNRLLRNMSEDLEILAASFVTEDKEGGKGHGQQDRASGRHPQATTEEDEAELVRPDTLSF